MVWFCTCTYKNQTNFPQNFGLEIVPINSTVQANILLENVIAQLLSPSWLQSCLAFRVHLIKGNFKANMSTLHIVLSEASCRM